MTPFTEVNELVNVLHIVPAKMHFVLSCITCFQPCGIKREDMLRSLLMTPFTEVNKLVNILHIVPAKMHFVISRITCLQPCGIKR